MAYVFCVEPLQLKCRQYQTQIVVWVGGRNTSNPWRAEYETQSINIYILSAVTKMEAGEKD